jgi:hypothetical protein
MKKHWLGWAALSGAIATAISLVLVLPVRAATSATFVHAGNAWGTKVQVGSLIVSTPSAKAEIGDCNAKTGAASAHKTALSIDIPGVLTSATIDSRVETGRSINSTFTRATETIEGLNLLGGTIKATALKALSEVRFTDGSGFNFQNGSSVLNLTINGQAIVAPAPNTRIDLPGIGFVIVNEQRRTVKPNFASQEVNLLHVHVTNAGNPLGLALGTDITVAHAHAGLSTPLPIGGLVNGSATGVFAQVGNAVKIGQSPHSSIPCLGGQNSATVASVNLPDLLSTSTLTTSAEGTLGPTKTVGHTTATVENVNVLNGLVKATAVRSVAHGQFNGTSYSFNSNGSTFLNLTVSGIPINPGVNRVIPIANVGTLYLYRVTKGPKSIEVRMIEIVLSTNNTLGLPGGTTVRVATANVSFP